MRTRDENEEGVRGAVVTTKSFAIELSGEKPVQEKRNRQNNVCRGEGSLSWRVVVDDREAVSVVCDDRSSKRSKMAQRKREMWKWKKKRRFFTTRSKSTKTQKSCVYV